MTPWVTRLIAANVVMFFVTMAAPVVLVSLMLVPALVLERPWTIVTYMFLHGGLWHLFFNMLGLYFFGPRLELEIGSKQFLGLYFISGLMGAALSFIFTPNTQIVGASGAIFGVMFGFAHFWPREPIYIWGILPVEVRWLVILTTGLSLVGGFGGASDGIAHFAHLGGFAGGFLFIKLMERTSRGARFQRELVPPPPRGDDMERWVKISRSHMHEVNRAELDRIMEKIKSSGAASLTLTERAFLDRFSQD